MRDRYAELMARPDRIEDVLRAGAQKAHLLSGPFMARLRDAVGLAREQTGAASANAGKASGRRARFVSFRDDKGAFRFRLLGSDGAELLLSRPYDHPKAAGAGMRRLQNETLDSLTTEEIGRAAWWERVCHSVLMLVGG